MNFSTYGPFEIKEMTPSSINATFEAIKEAGKDLQHSIGVYVFAAKDTSDQLVPWYVGKTNKEFGWRLRLHLDSGKFHELLRDKGPLSIFLMPRVTPRGKFVKGSAKLRAKGGLKSISQLEFALIGTCLTRNPELMNKQEKTFHSSMRVPGYWNSPHDEQDKSARKLAAMLKIRN